MWYRVKNGACGGGGSRTDSKNLFVTPSLKWQVEKRQRHHSWLLVERLDSQIWINFWKKSKLPLTMKPDMGCTKPWNLSPSQSSRLDVQRWSERNHETTKPLHLWLSRCPRDGVHHCNALSKLPKVKTSVLKNLLIFGENSSHKAPICLNLADFWLNTHVSYEGLPLCIIGSFVHWV